jgi:hypothetical protein
MTGETFTDRGADALERRILIVMSVSVIAAVSVSLLLAPWRVTAGLLLGGALSLLNFRWLHTSVAAIIELNARAGTAHARSLRYLLRYFVVGVVLFAAYQLNLVSLPAAIAGLCAFVPALLFEALRQFYFVIISREESY